MLSARIADVLTKFQSILAKFQTKERAGNSSLKNVNESRHTCTWRVADCIWEELNTTNIYFFFSKTLLRLCVVMKKDSQFSCG